MLWQAGYIARRSDRIGEHRRVEHQAVVCEQAVCGSTYNYCSIMGVRKHFGLYESKEWHHAYMKTKWIYTEFVEMCTCRLV